VLALVKETDLDWRVCSRARLSRDPRFDGKFFIAVRGSRVYCRSICPAPTANEENCRYFATAAAAAEAGYRPCLRCRPESSPGTPAWAGTSATVSRALRLIDEMGSEDGGMETLAERLGVGSRHLRRLFLRHLGATPKSVVQTRRMDFAKKLIDETNLPMTELAIAAGFGSVRRFNAGIRKTYHRTPTQIRTIARQRVALPENEYEFRLRFRPPYSWKGMLAFLAESATPGVEDIGSGAYRRTIALNGTDGSFEVSLDESRLALRARIRFGDPRALYFIVERIRALFDLNADWAKIARSLVADPMLSKRLKADPGLRVPGCWNGFELAVRAIIGRDVGSQDARDRAARMARAFGRPFPSDNGVTHLFPEPGTLAGADLAGIGLPKARADAIRALARAVCDGDIAFEGVVDSDAFLRRLRKVPGIDAWTAQYVAMRALDEPDAFPFEREDLMRALGLNDPAALDLRTERWRPWRAYAAMYLWAAADLDLARTEAKKTPHAPLRRRSA
jgi:AraC family transcriptional regulator of adaptative response / DNA-3-methyladenine glycosylase II